MSKPNPVITFSWNRASTNANTWFSEKCNVFDVQNVENLGSDRVVIRYKSGRTRRIGSWNDPFDAYRVRKRIRRQKQAIQRFENTKQLRILNNVGAK
jgi:hypothetical protein